MIPVSLIWDTRKGSMALQWNGFFFLGWENGRVTKRLLGIPVPFGFRRKRKKSDVSKARWADMKGALAFLKKWELKKVEGTLSFPDPMVNGIAYGWLSAIEAERIGRKVNLTINFLGENWCAGEAAVSPKILFYHLGRWFFSLLRGRKGRRPQKGGD